MKRTLSLVVVLALALRAAAAEPVPVAGGKATLSPDNTRINFIGTHAAPKKPDPRTGGFAKFKGQAAVDGKALKSVSVDIETESLWTEVGGRLTNHLKSADFLEVREFPTAKFASTKIEPAADGKTKITGNLTLHGKTKEISFPATVAVTDKGLTLASEFTIDRTDWGINYEPGQVVKQVTLKVAIGEKTQPTSGGR
ncbi:MAG TPA: YceI family protein [Pirellulaceae bacterium]|nr:YceI family protein [Pirellulaceae bacterium]